MEKVKIGHIYYAEGALAGQREEIVYFDGKNYSVELGFTNKKYSASSMESLETNITLGEHKRGNKEFKIRKKYNIDESLYFNELSKETEKEIKSRVKSTSSNFEKNDSYTQKKKSSKSFTPPSFNSNYSFGLKNILFSWPLLGLKKSLYGIKLMVLSILGSKSLPDWAYFKGVYALLHGIVILSPYYLVLFVLANLSK